MIKKIPDFHRATIMATELLCRQNLSERILDVKNLRYDKNIVFDTIQNYCVLTGIPITALIEDKYSILNDGCCLYDKQTDTYIILYNAFDSSFEHQNWTLAHEVGHIYLGHKSDGPIEEVEAHYFASQLFMPEFTLFMMKKEYGMFNAHDLTEIFGVSYAAAKKRIKNFEKRTLFNGSRKDVSIWEQQVEKIDLYYKCKKFGEDFRGSLEMKNWFDEEMRSLLYH